MKKLIMRITSMWQKKHTSEANRLNNLNYSKEEVQTGETKTLIEQVYIPNSPFKAIRPTGKDWFAIWGDNKISYEYENLETLLEQFEGTNWEILCNVIALMCYGTQKESAEKAIEEIKEELND